MGHKKHDNNNNRNSHSSTKALQRPSFSILEEHEHIRISFKQINDYDPKYLDDNALISDTDGEDLFDSGHNSTDLSDFLEEHGLEEEELDHETLASLFKFDQLGVLKRSLANESDIVKTLKTLMHHNSELLLNDQNKITFYKLLTKKYTNLTYKDFNKIIIFYGLYPSTFASIQLELPTTTINGDQLSSDSLLEMFQISNKDFEIDLDKWELKAKKNFEKGFTIPMGKQIAVKTLQDISLVKMALKCETCDKPLQPKNVSIKNMMSELPIEPEEKTKKKPTLNISEHFKCDQCSISFCSKECMGAKIQLHKNLHHPSLKYKPNVKIDGKKYHSLEMKILNNDLEDVFILLDLLNVDIPSPKFNICNLPVQKNNSNNNSCEDLYKEIFTLFKNVFTEYSLEFDEFLKDVGKCHYLNLFKSSESDTIYPITSILKHDCDLANVEIHNGVFYFIHPVLKGDIIKLDFYKHCTRNISSDIGRYTFLKSNFGINCKCDKCLKNGFLLNKRRKSSVRFVEKVTTFNLAQ
ncbi:hypothetical protein HANVADRAFT_54165 [Hanseniaspora valbyensis NRRL Y-1626]|uniref:Uncharacterized protein n=1 Tax=Hanseniaspora valbyensis NRRL Y-1626 TaxID=766949 RepID=A0A1B7T8I3_9ASCO|nr:hypothetical protein HANVADRAFT_54165 [Hanseniaspora valbyensis NRRL Y-1626]